jgi:hypothetical protein
MTKRNARRTAITTVMTSTRTQKMDLKNECEIENYNTDHSKNNFNDNFLKCINDAQNLNGVEQIFGPLEEEP